MKDFKEVNFYTNCFSKSHKHWIIVAGSESNVKVYDSIFTTVEDDTKTLREKWLGSRKVEIATCAQQDGCTDCGVYAVGYCVALAHYQDLFFFLLYSKLSLVLSIIKLAIV